MTEAPNWTALLGDGRTIQVIRREPSEHLHFWKCWDTQGGKWVVHDKQMTAVEIKHEKETK